MTKKKKEVEHQVMSEHNSKNQSSSTDGASERIVSSGHLDDDAMTDQATNRTASKLETANPQHNSVSLLDLPLEILFMVFDHAASRDHLENDCYTIQVVPEGDLRNSLVIQQPALLMVCSRLRTGLSAYFYSTCSFHVKIQMRSMISSTGDALTLKQLEDRLSLPSKLSSIKLTIEIHELSKEGFDFSVLPQIVVMLYEEYQPQYWAEGDEEYWAAEDDVPDCIQANRSLPCVDHMQLDWSLTCTDPVLRCDCVRTVIDGHLEWLLDDLHTRAENMAAKTPSEDFERVGSRLAKWPAEEEILGDRTYWIRGDIRDCLSATTSDGRANVLWPYYELCSCSVSDFDSNGD